MLVVCIRDANAADKAGGVGISLSVGASSSQSRQQSSADSARGSTLTAGGKVSIAATGAGKDSDITIQGSDIKAGGQASLKADDQVSIVAAQNTTSESSSSKNSSGSVGVGFNLGAGGAQMGITVSASTGKGQGAGNSTTYTNSHVTADKVQIESGGDTTLKGGVVSAEQVTAKVGGNLTIESLQDSSQYKEKSQQVGGSVTVGPASGGSVNLAQTRINSDYLSVGEQSAIRAGDGGFNISVDGKTNLTGVQITSTQAAIDNNKNSYASAGGTETKDLQNSANYSANSVSVGVGAGSPAPGAALSAGMSGVGIGSDKGSAASTTTAGISGVTGDAAARTGDKSTSIAPIFDKEKTQKEVAAQVAITQEFGKQASKLGGTEADKQREALKAQAKQAQDSGNTEQAQTLLAEAAKWDEGGEYRVAMHTVIGGLTGGTSGAVGAGAGSAAAPALNELQSQLQQGLQKAGLGESASKVIASLASGATAAGIGAAASGGTTAGAATAFNADMNNRQLHPDEKKKIAELAKTTGLSEDKLTRAACYAVKCWAEYPEGSKEREANFVSVGETFGLSKELAVIQSTGASTGLFNYSTLDQTKDVFKATALPVIKNSVKTVGGGLAVATGSTICTTSGPGCVVGAPLAAFGASEATEGATGLYRQYQGQGAAGVNPIRNGLNAIWPTWGDTAYDATYLGLSVLALGAPVPLKVGASDGIDRVNSLFGATVPRWQNPIINPLTNNVLLPQPATQGLMIYGVGAKVPAIVQDVQDARSAK